MSTQEIYCKAIRQELGRYYATWLPHTKIEVGDYGYLENNCFMKLGNLATDLGIDFVAKCYEADSFYQIAKSSDLDITFNAKGEVQGASNACVTVKFKRKNAIFFKCQCIKTESIDSLMSLKEPLMQNPKWKLDYVFVSDLFHTTNNTIIISNSKNAEVVLESENSIIGDLNNKLNLGLNVVKQSATDFCYSSTDSINPFVRVATLKKKLFQDDFTINYRENSFNDDTIGDLENSVIFEIERID